MVAESIVIFGPICQVGCLRASSRVALRISIGGPGAERAAGRGEDDLIDFGVLAGMHGLEDGRVFAVNRDQSGTMTIGERGDEAAGDDESFLIGQADGHAALDGTERGGQAGGADDGGEEKIGGEFANEPIEGVGA